MTRIQIIYGLHAVVAAAALCCASSTFANQTASPETKLAPPSERPMQLDLSKDPILQLRQNQADRELFQNAIRTAVLRHPQLAEAEANGDVAQAALDEAIERRLPAVDASITSYRVISRAFSNDPDNIIERSRAARRTDAQLTIQQPLFDFGGGAARVAAAKARVKRVGADLETAAGQTALNAIAAYYEVFGYRALVSLTQTFIHDASEFRESLQERIRLGVSAEGDIARVETAEAGALTRLAGYERQLASAEARFIELTGTAAPQTLERAPAAESLPASREEATIAGMSTAVVRSAEADAEAANKEAKARKSERMPQITAGIDAGRYGVFETERDYDVRGRVTARINLFGGVEPRIRQSSAQARVADARADRIREQASRDAAIAWADVRALENQLDAQETAYTAGRQTRDVIVARFRARRGTAFDVASAEQAYFDSAASYIQVLIEYDTSRYVLLFQTGRLLDSLRINPARLETNIER